MTDERSVGYGSSIDRRDFLGAIGAGAAGVAAMGGLASAEEYVQVVETEPLATDVAREQFEVAMGDERETALAEAIGEETLLVDPERAYGYHLVTDDEEYNEHQPTAIVVPYVAEGGPQYGYGIYSTVTFTDGGRRHSFEGDGLAIQNLGGEWTLWRYALVEGEPTIVDEREVRTTYDDGFYDPEAVDRPIDVGYDDDVLDRDIYDEWYEPICFEYICGFEWIPGVGFEVEWCEICL